MIYSKTDKENSIYKVSHFGLHFFEVRLQEDISIQDFDNKYKIQNYNGHFTLSLHQVDSNIEYRLYYKDILVGSCIGYFFILFVMHTILVNMNLDSWLFEHKVKKEELLEYFQYFIWDKRNTKVWYMNQFNQKFHEKSNLSIDHYKGDISIKQGKLIYKEDVIFIFHPYTSDEIFSIPSLRFFFTIGMHSRNLVDTSSKITNELDTFRKHVMGSSDEMLESWVYKKSGISK